ncbi:hypothetical protein HDV05_005192 [Chytridiales sp. JEL 0842]|nr:hypothetical protein HDV05_005192 [Chytridiales sp. JEL 0842]
MGASMDDYVTTTQQPTEEQLKHFPPWRVVLEQALVRNETPDHSQYFASLATIKAFGRPANRTVFFRGFLGDGKQVPTPSAAPAAMALHHPHDTATTTTTTSSSSSSSSGEEKSALQQPHAPTAHADAHQHSHHHHHHHHHHHNNDHHQHGHHPQHAAKDHPKTTLTHAGPHQTERVANVLIFAIDVRSGSVQDLLHGSRFAEVCWYLPLTREQFRISGELHLVLDPQHPLTMTHKVPEPFAGSVHFPGLDWEQRRHEIWRRLSAVRRASFTWPEQKGVGGQGLKGDSVVMVQPKNTPSGHKEEGKKTLMEGKPYTSLADATANAQPITHLEASPMLTPSTTSSNAPLSPLTTTNTTTTTTTHTTPHKQPSDLHLPPSTVGGTTGTLHLLTPHKHTHGEPTPHQIALRNFALLLLDVDGVDHLRMQTVPHVRTKYRRAIDTLVDHTPTQELEGFILPDPASYSCSMTAHNADSEKKNARAGEVPRTEEDKRRRESMSVLEGMGLAGLGDLSGSFEKLAVRRVSQEELEGGGAGMMRMVEEPKGAGELGGGAAVVRKVMHWSVKEMDPCRFDC